MRNDNNYKDFYDKMHKIGEGGFGAVYKVKVKGKDKYRAIKIINKELIKKGLRNEYNKQDIEKEYLPIKRDLNDEVKFMKICGNNNIYSVKIYEYFDTEQEFIIVMELCDENIMDFIKRTKKSFDFKEIYNLLRQLNNTFKIMSDNNIAHRDLKLENILIKYENKEKTKYIFKLTGYGISKQLLTLSKRFTTKVGTLNLMAPEILEGEKYNIECDLWSLGIILHLLYFKDYPYKAEMDFAILKQIKSLKDKLIKRSNNDKFDDLLRKLLIIDPRERLSWKDYFNHPFFENKPFAEQKTERPNEIIIKLKVGKIDRDKNKNFNEFKNIYFLENENINVDGEQVHENIDNLNKSIKRIFINDKPYMFSKFYKPDVEGEYKIKIEFKNKLNDCSYMFKGCVNITEIDLSSFDSSNVTDMKHMFSICSNLQKINFSNLKTEKVSDMSYMFNKCINLEKIEFPSTFNTQNVRNMSFMFHWCQNLSNIKFPSLFITNNVTNMKGMFGKCYNLKGLDLGNFMTENVKNMSYMFDQCNNLEEILINTSKFSTKQVNNMGHMFSNCNVLKNLDLSFFNTEKVEYFCHMFNKCEKLKNLNLSNIHNEENCNMIHMFDGCSELENLNISSIIIGNDEKIKGMFDNLKNIKGIKVNPICIGKYIENFKEIESKFLRN